MPAETKHVARELFALATADCTGITRFFQSAPFRLRQPGTEDEPVPSLPINCGHEVSITRSSGSIEDDKEYPPLLLAFDQPAVQSGHVMDEFANEVTPQGKASSGSHKELRAPKRRNHSIRLNQVSKE